MRPRNTTANPAVRQSMIDDAQVMVKATMGHPKAHENLLRGIERLKSEETVEVNASDVSDFLPLILWRWRELYGEKVLVHGDGRIEPVPDAEGTR